MNLITVCDEVLKGDNRVLCCETGIPAYNRRSRPASLTKGHLREAWRVRRDHHAMRGWVVQVEAPTHSVPLSPTEEKGQDGVQPAQSLTLLCSTQVFQGSSSPGAICVPKSPLRPFQGCPWGQISFNANTKILFSFFMWILSHKYTTFSTVGKT